MAHSFPRPVVVYDGDCAFCRRHVTRLQRRDRAGVFELAPRQHPGLLERFPGLADGDFDTGMRLVESDGTIHVGADAVYHVARHLPGWRRLAWIYRVPVLRPALRAAYGLIARNRHRLGPRCDDGECKVGPAASDR